MSTDDDTPYMNQQRGNIYLKDEDYEEASQFYARSLIQDRDNSLLRDFIASYGVDISSNDTENSLKEKIQSAFFDRFSSK